MKMLWKNVVNVALFFFTIPLFLVVVGINIIFYYFILTYKEYCENIVAIYCVNIFLLLYKQVKQKILPTKKKKQKK